MQNLLYLCTILKIDTMCRRIICVLLLGWAVMASAVDRAYYSSLEGKSGAELRDSIMTLLFRHHTTFLSYDWEFPYDYDSDGNLLDIYSDCGFNSHQSYTSDYKCCCDAINREHVVCQSNFGGSKNEGKIPQYSDRHHLYPVDGRANGHRSDLPFGECSGGNHGNCSKTSLVYPDEGTSTCALHEYGRSGTSTFSVPLPSGAGKVYEVGDAYKGDIARAILYMVVRYAKKEYCRLPDGAAHSSTALRTPNDYPVTAWANTDKDKVGQMFSDSLHINHGLSEYGKALLVKWHRQDPVSQKEIDRNNGIEAAQGNRNPFVDYPYLVEYLWGVRSADAFRADDVLGSFEQAFIPDVSDGSGATAPVILPNHPSVVTDDVTSISGETTDTIIVIGNNLTGDISIAISGSTYFSTNISSITPAEAASGKEVIITYHPGEQGVHSAILTLTSVGASAKTVELYGKCCVPYTLTLMRNTIEEKLTCCGVYDLPAVSAEEDACEGWAFHGWTTAPCEQTAPPEYITSVSGAATVYAVYYQKESEGASTIEYTRHTGVLTEGDYIFFYQGRAMKARIVNHRLTYDTITVEEDTIVSWNDSLRWHVAPSGNYWTIYNAQQGKYAAANGTKNQLQLLTDGTVDMALWTVGDTIPDAYDFSNKYNLARSINNRLRNNGTYGFACYSWQTGKPLSLYKRGSVVVNFATEPCPPSDPTAISRPADKQYARKALQDGRMVIYRGETPYTLMGQEIR